MVRSYFNPRSLVGNDMISVYLRYISTISIHVPSWGTTATAGRSSICTSFQSTFPRGERPAITGRSSTAMSFQSTFPRGERQEMPVIFQMFLHFNPRSLVGNDCHSTCRIIILIAFQSTFPRGERRQIFTNILCFFMQ